MCRSVPQMDAILTLTSTSVRPNCGLGTSRISMPGAGVGLTTASMVFDMRMALGSRFLRSAEQRRKSGYPRYVSPVRIRSGGQTSKFNMPREGAIRTHFGDGTVSDSAAIVGVQIGR